VADGVADDCHLIGIVIRDLPRIHHDGAAVAAARFHACAIFATLKIFFQRVTMQSESSVSMLRT